jgi:hypothetical protein
MLADAFANRSRSGHSITSGFCDWVVAPELAAWHRIPSAP